MARIRAKNSNMHANASGTPLPPGSSRRVVFDANRNRYEREIVDLTRTVETLTYRLNELLRCEKNGKNSEALFQKDLEFSKLKHEADLMAVKKQQSEKLLSDYKQLNQKLLERIQKLEYENKVLTAEKSDLQNGNEESEKLEMIENRRNAEQIEKNYIKKCSGLEVQVMDLQTRNLSLEKEISQFRSILESKRTKSTETDNILNETAKREEIRRSYQKILDEKEQMINRLSKENTEMEVQLKRQETQLRSIQEENTKIQHEIHSITSFLIEDTNKKNNNVQPQPPRDDVPAEPPGELFVPPTNSTEIEMKRTSNDNESVNFSEMPEFIESVNLLSRTRHIEVNNKSERSQAGVSRYDPNENVVDDLNESKISSYELLLREKDDEITELVQHVENLKNQVESSGGQTESIKEDFKRLESLYKQLSNQHAIEMGQYSGRIHLLEQEIRVRDATVTEMEEKWINLLRNQKRSMIHLTKIDEDLGARTKVQRMEMEEYDDYEGGGGILFGEEEGGVLRQKIRSLKNKLKNLMSEFQVSQVVKSQLETKVRDLENRLQDVESLEMLEDYETEKMKRMKLNFEIRMLDLLNDLKEKERKLRLLHKMHLESEKTENMNLEMQNLLLVFKTQIEKLLS